MGARAASALSTHAFRPTWEIGAALGVHFLLAAALFIGEQLSHADTKPLIDPTIIMMVQPVALPKQTTRMPERPSRTPDAPKAAAAQPSPSPTPTPPPPETASDLVVHKKDAPPPPQAPEIAPDRTQDRDALMNQIKKQQLLKDMSAEVGDVDRPRTDPNGVDPADAIFGSGIGAQMDKEAAAWWKKAKPLIWANWTPLPATVAAHPTYMTQVKVIIQANGTISDPQVLKGTGDASYDRSAVMAMLKTGRLPPPPAKFADAWGKTGTVIGFPAKDSS